MTLERVPMTKDAYERLKAEIYQLENIEMPAVATQIGEARSEGDLSENAEYHAARDKQALLQARIDEKKDKVARALIVDPSTLPTDTVVFGSRVKIRDLESGDEEAYDLVGPGDEDYENNRILTSSPRGQALLGKKVGDTAEVKVPRGVLRYEIVEISSALT